MDNVTQQSVTIARSLNQDRQMMRKETGPWFEDRHNNGNEGQPLMFEPCYYNYRDNVAPIGTFIDISGNVQWWKDTSVTNLNAQLECQQEAVTPSIYPLTNHSTNAQSDPLQQEESNAKKSVKPKQSKKPKSIKERREPLKRTKHPELWKVNLKKNARLRGEEYVGVGGKIVAAKAMGPPCKCRMRCSEKIDESAREELHNIFWKTCSWEQRKQYVALSVKESPKQRTRCRGNVKSEHRRQVTFTYSLLLKGEFTTVCKCMFLSTFAVSEKFVRHVMDKKRVSSGGVIGPDQRGRHTPKTKKSEFVKERVREHIKSFPADKSTNPKDRTGKRYLDSRLSIAAMHKLYVLQCKEEGSPDSDIVKESYYREMFKTEFNLGFKPATSKENKLSQGVTDGNGTITRRLSPPFLGSLRTRVRETNNEREETKESDTKLPSGTKERIMSSTHYEPAASPVRRAHNGDLLYFPTIGERFYINKEDPEHENSKNSETL